MSAHLARKLSKLIKCKSNKDHVFLLDCQSGERKAIPMEALISEVYKPTPDKEVSV